MDPVRIAFDVGPLLGHRTGVGAAVDALSAALRGHPDVELRPYVLSFRSRPAPPTRRLPLPAAVAHELWSRLDGPRLDRWLGDVDVVHGTNYVVPPTRHPALVSVYDCWFLSHPAEASSAVRRAGEVLRRRVRAGAMVHASSHATADGVRQLLGTSRVEVVPLGPLAVDDPPAGTSPAPWTTALDGAPFVLALGTLERRKNLPALVAAFATATATNPTTDVHLVVAGAPGDDTDALDTAVGALVPEVRNRIVRPGPVDAATKAWLLHHARALAYPSLDEGFGFPLLEAQQVGLPIVATRAGSIPEVAGDGAELVPVGDRDALAAALLRVVTDEDRRATLTTAGRANLARFSWATTADALIGIYRHLREETS
jgi:glycosyltransferase involved in cell wall biosynthesis